MKKMVIGLAAALMLSGCANPAAFVAETTQPTETEAQPTQPQEPARSYYVPDSPTERATGGAVSVYQMDGNVTGVSMLGENLLVCTDNRVLHLLSGSSMEEIRTRELEGELEWGAPDLRITDSGVAYYDEVNASYMTFDENLVSESSFAIAGKPDARPILSEDGTSIYFVAENGIQVMDLQAGTTRMLRQEHEQIIRLDGILFDNSCLYYTRAKSDGTEQTCFVDTNTGSMIRSVRFHGRMVSHENRFESVMKVSHAMGQSEWIVLGDQSGPLKMMTMEDGWGDPILLENGYVILQQRNKVGVSLVCYDTAAEKELARVILPQRDNLFSFAAAGDGKIWLCDGAGSRFYQWNLPTSAQQEAPVAQVLDYASLSHPDEEAMASVTAQSQTLAEELGMEIAFAQNGNRTEDGDYKDLPDYMPMQYEKALEQLEIAAQRLPAGLAKKLGLKVELTDRYDPTRETVTSGGSFHLDGGTAGIQIDMCPDVEAIFYHELFHVMEVKIRNRGDDLDRWKKLNPKGFEYTGTSDSATQDIPESKAAADGYAMVNPREDRAQTFMYACMSGQEDRFASDIMQEKLQFLSKQLRKSFDISEAPIWEQYLRTENGSSSGG